MRRLLILFLLIVLLLVGSDIYILHQARAAFGAPAPSLWGVARLRYAARLLLVRDALLSPADPYAADAEFRVYTGESVSSIAARLHEASLIRDPAAFQTYLVYSGIDRALQPGDYFLSASMTPIEIAKTLQNPAASSILFVVLSGWRMEEIAETLPASGLDIAPDAFLAAARSPSPRPDFLPDSASAEGFLAPGEYRLRRETTASELVAKLMGAAARRLTPELREGFAAQGLSVYEGVILASIVQREALLDEERPLIASVFLNRLAAGMKLESDPTVQYALGYDEAAQTWWKAPLLLDDLSTESPFNTYLHKGLPPAPISNPSEGSLRSVAFPAQTAYYYFRARCDGSGRHAFAETFEEHLENACP